jgi:uncharacterized membrane protein
VDGYLLLKFVHVVSAIIAVGFNASYGFWLARAARQPQTLPFVLSTVRLIDNVANGFYAVLLVTGLALVYLHGLDLRAFWLAAALALYVLAVFVGIVLYRPVLARQRAALTNAGPASAEFASASARSRTLGILTGVIVLIIVFLMVTKPMPFAL